MNGHWNMDVVIRKKTKYSVRVKFVGIYILVLSILLVLMNTYPIKVSRDLVFHSKEDSLTNQTWLISSSLSAMETLTEEGVSQVMGFLTVMSAARIIITDNAGLILYDTSEVDSRVGSFALLAEINYALSGKVVFYSTFVDGVFMSRAAMPVNSRNNIIGAVYLYEYDKDQGALITGIQNNLMNISIGLAIVSIVVMLVFATALTKRIRELVRAVRIIREGKYDHHVRTRGRDEVSELGEEFNNMAGRLEDTEALRRRFVSDASHELKTPLASIRLLTDSIIHSADMDSATMREFVEDIDSEADRLRRMTEKLLSLTRMDTIAPATRTAVDVKKVCENTYRLLAPLAEKDGITLSLELEDGCCIFASEDDIYQIIFNLVENAIKYNLDKGSVSLRLRREGRQVVMTVEDTGIGIPAADMPNIFTRFYRVDKARSREAGGSGLGLSIVHDAVVLYGGTIGVSQVLPNGTCFTVRFPLYSEEENNA